METEKEKLEKMENLYHMVVRFQQKNHEKNQKRIRIGLRCIYIIPAVFLFLLFVTDSSKIIFLVLWIVSLFALAIYLITVEYMDYNLQKQMNKLEGRKHAPEYIWDTMRNVLPGTKCPVTHMGKRESKKAYRIDK